MLVERYNTMQTWKYINRHGGACRYWDITDLLCKQTVELQGSSLKTQTTMERLSKHIERFSKALNTFERAVGREKRCGDL